MQTSSPNATGSSSSGLISRVINIITKPKQEWENVAKEEANTGKIVLGYALPLSLIPAIATAIGLGLIEKRISILFATTTIKSWEWGITSGVTSLITTLLAVFITALIVDLLAPSFQSEKNFGRSLQLTVYGFTPAWIAGIFNIIPMLSWLSFIGGLYGIYLMYLAFVPVKKTPQDKAIIYLLATIGILIVVYILLAVIIGAIMAAFYTLQA